MSRRSIWAAAAGVAFVAALGVSRDAGAQAAAPSTENAEVGELEIEIHIKFESQIDELTSADLQVFALETLNDPRSWRSAGFVFTAGEDAPYRVVVAEPDDTRSLCGSLASESYSCQNGAVVAINGDRWRGAFDGWNTGIEDYRRYVINHEVGHLAGQFHPGSRCPSPGFKNAVMEQQSKGLAGCLANAWPLSWELQRAAERPALIAPTPDRTSLRPVPNLGGQADQAVADPSLTSSTMAPETTVPATTVITVAPPSSDVTNTATAARASVTTSTTTAAPDSLPIDVHGGVPESSSTDYKSWLIALAGFGVGLSAVYSMVLFRRHRHEADDRIQVPGEASQFSGSVDVGANLRVLAVVSGNAASRVTKEGVWIAPDDIDPVEMSNWMIFARTCLGRVRSAGVGSVQASINGAMPLQPIDGRPVILATESNGFVVVSASGGMEVELLVGDRRARQGDGTWIFPVRKITDDGEIRVRPRGGARPRIVVAVKQNADPTNSNSDRE